MTLSLPQEEKQLLQKMKYADKFPHLIPILDEVEGIIRVRTPRACCECNRITEYLEVNYGIPLCSEECLDNIERRIAEELREELPFEQPDDFTDLSWGAF